MIGWRWYTDARALVYGLADIHGKDPQTVAGVIAALSQAEAWKRNVRRAVAALETGRVTGGLGMARRRAQRILDGQDPLTVLRGLKTRAFYRAILGDDNAVVIDRWMCRAYGHHEKPTERQYHVLAERVRREAAVRNCPPAMWQAHVWATVRGGEK